MTSMPLRFVHITDTHLGRSGYALKGVPTLPCAERLISGIRRLPFAIDFIIHTGDIATEVPERDHYETAARVFRDVPCPVHFLPGNHDDVSLIRELLPVAESRAIESDPRSGSFRLDIGGHTFVGIDARDFEADEDSRGRVSSEQLELIREVLVEGVGSVTLFVHFPPLELDSPWHDPGMILRGGEELHGVLTGFHGRLRGVFCGHVHRTIQVVRDGILYSAGASTCVQFPASPVAEESVYDPEPSPSFQLVSYVDDRTIVKLFRV